MRAYPALLLALALVTARAHALAPEEFAQGLELQATKAGPIQAFTLPPAVLTTLIDPAYGDLCIFDAQGKQLAQAVTIPEERPELVDVAVPFFPLETRARDATGGVAVSVERDADGAIKRAFSEPMMANSTRVVGYLLDRSGGARDPVEALTLAVTAAAAFTMQVQVETSDDLHAFSPITSATVARLEHDGRTLKRDVIELPPARSRYLRLSFRNAPSDLTLTDVTARVQRPIALRPRRVIALQGEPRDDADAQVFQYTLVGSYAPDRYRVLLPEGTSLVDATLESAEQADGPYGALDRGIFRRDDSADATAPSPVRELPRTHDRFFRLRVASKGGGVQRGSPTLQLGYLPPRLLFHAEGPTPYLLAFGSARARCKQFAEAELVSITPEPAPSEDSVVVVQERTLGGDAVRSVREDLPLRTYLLWVVLIIAVAVLAVLARKLLRTL